jgi:hypothetical protein
MSINRGLFEDGNSQEVEWEKEKRKNMIKERCTTGYSGHAYNPSYSGGRNKQDWSSQPA